MLPPAWVNWLRRASARQDNLERLRRENLLGKASRSRVEDILSIFRQRYLSEESVTEARTDHRLCFPGVERFG